MSSAREIAAFFDIDGTLIPNPSLEWRFIAFLLSRDDIGLKSLGSWTANFLKKLPHGLHAATDGNKHYLAGLRESLAAEWSEATMQESNSFRIPFFSEGVERVIWHAVQHHRIVLVSGTLEPLAHTVAGAIADTVATRAGVHNSIEVIATKLESANSAWTGRILGKHMSGHAKAAAIHGLSESFGIDLKNSYAYGNRWSDLLMLQTVGHPMAVNPGTGLERMAYEAGWQVRRWSRSIPGAAPMQAQLPSFDGAQ